MWRAGGRPTGQGANSWRGTGSSPAIYAPFPRHATVYSNVTSPMTCLAGLRGVQRRCLSPHPGPRPCWARTTPALLCPSSLRPRADRSHQLRCDRKRAHRLSSSPSRTGRRRCVSVVLDHKGPVTLSVQTPRLLAGLTNPPLCFDCVPKGGERRRKRRKRRRNRGEKPLN